MTYEEFSKQLLRSFTIEEHKIDTIMSIIKENYPYREIPWDQSIESASCLIKKAIERIVIQEAIDFIEDLNPKSWMLPAIREKLFSL